MDYIRPPALHKGDTIGIIAPSSYIESDLLDAGVAVLRDYGFGVSIHPQTLSREHQSAGSPVEKAAAIHEMFASPEIKAIIGAGGGNRAAHSLGNIDFGLIRSNPKIYMGLSDSTSLLSALASQAGLVSFFGPLVKTLPKTETPCLDFAFSLLGGKSHEYPLTHADTLHEGTATGRLIGGTLSVFQSLIGTPYMPDLDGAILFLEDIGDELSRYDRMLWQLRTAIPFERLAGIVFGQFLNVHDTGRPFGYVLEDIFREHTAGLKIPVIMNAPFGHGPVLYPLPVGLPASLEARPGSAVLKMLESPVAS